MTESVKYPVLAPYKTAEKANTSLGGNLLLSKRNLLMTENDSYHFPKGKENSNRICTVMSDNASLSSPNTNYQ